MDPIADMLTRIRNAQRAGHEQVEAPFSKVKFELVKLLQREGYLGQVEKKKAHNKEKLVLGLKYSQGGQPVIDSLRRVSKPGCRIHIQAEKIKPLRQGYGRMIISTSRGLMTDKEAKKNKLGGEVLCEIW